MPTGKKHAVHILRTLYLKKNILSQVILLMLKARYMVLTFQVTAEITAYVGMIRVGRIIRGTEGI